jgi:hypothetical protein
MQSNEDIYVIVKHWLTQNCPRRYKAGDGMPVEVAMYVNEHIESHGGVWSFASLDAALADFVRENSFPYIVTRVDKNRIRVNAAMWNFPPQENLRKVHEHLRDVEDETKAQDCVFLWQCGIKADF